MLNSPEDDGMIAEFSGPLGHFPINGPEDDSEEGPDDDNSPPERLNAAASEGILDEDRLNRPAPAGLIVP